MTVSFAISEWSGWMPNAATDNDLAKPIITDTNTPDVSLIPPMLRRRLNLLGRACASELLKHVPKGTNIPVVYCSRHGDIERTLGVLTELASGEAVSPTRFSLAVHNAISGILSIHAGLTANISAIAAGQEGLLPVLLEASGILSQKWPKVLCVICDVPLPEPYQEHCLEPESPFAVSFIVTQDEGVRLELQIDEAEETPILPEAQMLFLNFLSSEANELLIGHNGSAWRISKH